VTVLGQPKTVDTKEGEATVY